MYEHLMDLWTLLGFSAISVIAGGVTGAIALLLGGAGSVRVLAKRLETLEERQDDLGDRMTTEVKRRASLAAKDVREKRGTDADVISQAKLVLAEHEAANPPQRAPQARKRPSVITGV